MQGGGGGGGEEDDEVVETEAEPLQVFQTEEQMYEV